MSAADIAWLALARHDAARAKAFADRRRVHELRVLEQRLADANAALDALGAAPH